MPVRKGPPEPAPPPKSTTPGTKMPSVSSGYPAEKARAGEIILRTPARRTIFIAGLVGIVLVAFLAGVFA